MIPNVGLDYALLRKTRETIEKERLTQEPQEEADDFTKDLSRIETCSSLGAKMKSYLISRLPRSMASSVNATTDTKIVKMFKQLAFEFDIDPSSEVAIPTSVANSHEVLIFY